MPGVKATPENPIEMLAVVALLRDLPEYGLLRGEAGTVVEHLSPTVVEVEFVDADGRTRAMAEVAAEDLLVLHLNPIPQVS